MVKVEKDNAQEGTDGNIVPSKCGSTQKMAANIKVVVRVRPLNEREIGRLDRIVVDIVDDKMLVFDPKEQTQPFYYQGVQQPTKNYLKRANKELKFLFDHVCGQETNNFNVFESTTKDMMSSLMEGYNCSVFVYGATGAGKTFTMIGNQEHPGITYLTMDHLFSIIDSFENEREFDIGVSYIEVYNENVFDLINPSKTPLQLREDTNFGVVVAGLTVTAIKTARELLDMLENGNKNRTQHPTDANAESSRSHAVFQVYIKMSYKTSSKVRVVKLSMIDLAGSERASATGCAGDRFKEGANINKSLLSLANCINKLADGCSYIPYRDSKLTRLLKDSLGGNCKTIMIANVSPSSSSYEDTYNTLKYAARANKIQLSIKKNTINGDVRLSQYVKINEELKKKVRELEAKLTIGNQKRDGDAKNGRTVEDLKKKVKELEAKLTLSSLRPVEDNRAKLKLRQEWRQRIEEEESLHGALESEVLRLMTCQRVLAQRRNLRRREYHQITELVHRSSSEAMKQVCTEDIPRQERAEESHMKQARRTDRKIMSVWAKWDDSCRKLAALKEQALAACPDLADFIKLTDMQAKYRRLQANDNLRYKLLHIEHKQLDTFTEYMTDMPNMLKKLFLILKGYERTTPALTAEYVEVMKKLKSAKAISWSDENTQNDPFFKFISKLDLNNPASRELDTIINDDEAASDTITDSDLTDLENQDPVRLSGTKRKGTPIKLATNETIVIDDSFDNLDVTRNLGSAKKKKLELDASYDIENMPSGIQAKNLNCTFDMAGKMELKFDPPKTALNSQPVQRELCDRTNTMHRGINFNGPKIVKPVVGRALPLRRPITAPPGVQARAGFGSSLARDGTPMQRNGQVRGKDKEVNNRAVGFKAVRGRQRVELHPYTRTTARK